ncbi:MAG: prolipoprotein diacylglyceryl transferase [Candidatus Omnitrophica bacterium CG12_big_fil_rev_8_21_14_0_65_42_8]|nr:MAG: prolipoprotein diacylglyceryl transferase [Candidatus Omnitrophica bacterium CG12_big_fil_rev_8_21_14_0_65_42_8]
MHPIIAKIGPFTIYSYGIMVAIAFLFGIFIARREAVRKNIKPGLVYDLGFYLLIGSIIGARIYYILFFGLKDFLAEPASIFKVWQGGLAIHGGIFGGIITSIIFSNARKISFWALADLIAPSIILGQAIGRIGCYLNGCCYGINNQPTQIYELILDFIGFLLLWGLRKKIRFKGGLFLLYLMTYSVIRIIVSQFRADNLYLWNTGITLAGLSSLIIFIIAMALFIRKRHV